MIRPREEVIAAFRLSDPGDKIDQPCKHTLAAQALYRVDAFEEWIDDFERRSAALAIRETQVAAREYRLTRWSRVIGWLAVAVAALEVWARM